MLIVVGGYAPSIKISPGSNNANTYALMILLINPICTTISAHICLTTKVCPIKLFAAIFNKLCQKLKKTDGDGGFNSKHSDCFERYVDPVLKGEGNFIEKVSNLRNEVNLPVSLFHF